MIAFTLKASSGAESERRLPEFMQMRKSSVGFGGFQLRSLAQRGLLGFIGKRWIGRIPEGRRIGPLGFSKRQGTWSIFLKMVHFGVHGRGLFQKRGAVNPQNLAINKRAVCRRGSLVHVYSFGKRSEFIGESGGFPSSIGIGW